MKSALPSNAMIIAKALSLAPRFYDDVENFKAGQSFKSRFNISYMKAHGEKQNADLEEADIF